MGPQKNVWTEGREGRTGKKKTLLSKNLGTYFSYPAGHAGTIDTNNMKDTFTDTRRLTIQDAGNWTKFLLQPATVEKKKEK